MTTSRGKGKRRKRDGTDLLSHTLKLKRGGRGGQRGGKKGKEKKKRQQGWALFPAI